MRPSKPRAFGGRTIVRRGWCTSSRASADRGGVARSVRPALRHRGGALSSLARSLHLRGRSRPRADPRVGRGPRALRGRRPADRRLAQPVPHLDARLRVQAAALEAAASAARARAARVPDPAARDRARAPRVRGVHVLGRDRPGPAVRGHAGDRRRGVRACGGGHRDGPGGYRRGRACRRPAGAVRPRTARAHPARRLCRIARRVGRGLPAPDRSR